MKLATISPDPELTPYVHSFIHYTHYDPIAAKERVIPDGSPYLIFALDGYARRVFDNSSLEPAMTLTGAWLSGVQRDFLTIEALGESRMAVVRFRAGGARPVLGAAMDRSNGRILPVDELGPIGVPQLLASLLKTDDAEACWSIVREWLLSRVQHGPRVSTVVQDAVSAIESDPLFANHGLADLVAASGYSEKQFIHHFKREVGLTPKAFQRMMRFQEILPRVIGRQDISWASVSQQCGYYDQSHFIREFRRFSGYSPSEYLRGGADRTNFLPFPDA